MANRLKVKLLLVAVVAVGISVGVGLSPVGVVFACPSGYVSCTLERSVTNYADVYESPCNCYVRWYWTLNTYNSNGGGAKHYEMTVSTGSQDIGAGAVTVAAYVRVWVCGGYQGEWSHISNYTFRSTVVSPEFNYFTCGRQADDGASPSSYIDNIQFWPDPASVYENQG